MQSKPIDPGHKKCLLNIGQLDNLGIPPKIVLNVLVPGLASLLKAAKLCRVQATEDPDQWLLVVV